MELEWTKDFIVVFLWLFCLTHGLVFDSCNVVDPDL
jgi:hypothetical protein